jgi:hypothetical protein
MYNMYMNHHGKTHLTAYTLKMKDREVKQVGLGMNTSVCVCVCMCVGGVVNGEGEGEKYGRCTLYWCMKIE